MTLADRFDALRDQPYQRDTLADFDDFIDRLIHALSSTRCKLTVQDRAPDRARITVRKRRSREEAVVIYQVSPDDSIVYLGSLGGGVVHPEILNDGSVIWPDWSDSWPEWALPSLESRVLSPGVVVGR